MRRTIGEAVMNDKYGSNWSSMEKVVYDNREAMGCGTVEFLNYGFRSFFLRFGWWDTCLGGR